MNTTPFFSRYHGASYGAPKFTHDAPSVGFVLPVSVPSTTRSHDVIRNQDVVSQFELGGEQPIEFVFEMESTPCLPLLSHASVSSPGMPQRPA